MKFIQVLTVVGMVLSINLSVFGQEPDAKETLAETSAKIHDFKSVQIEFEYSINTVEEADDEIYTGDVAVKGKKYKLSIDETVTYSDGKTRWVYLVESNEVNVSTVSMGEDLELEEQFLNEPLSIYDLYTKGFKVRLNGTGKMDDLKVYEIDLTPNDLDKPYFKIRYLITENNDLYSVQYFQKDGTKVLLRIKEVDEGQKYKDADFVFKAADYPDVEVIDLR